MFLGDGIVANGYGLGNYVSALILSSLSPLRADVHKIMRARESRRTEAVDSCETSKQEQDREQQERVPQATDQLPSFTKIRCGYAVLICIPVSARRAKDDHIDVHGISCEREDDQEIVAREMPCVV